MILLQEATRYIAMGVKYVLRNFPGCFNINKSMGTLYDIFMILRLFYGSAGYTKFQDQYSMPLG